VTTAPAPDLLPLKMYACCTASHRTLADQWFLRTLQDNYNLILEKIDAPNGSSRYKDASWMSAVEAKADLILRALKENDGSVFIFSDVDIRFLGKTEPEVLARMKDHDLAVLQDSPYGTLGTGFFACRSNPGTRALWADVLAFMRAHPGEHDQEALNHLWCRKSSLQRRLAWKLVSFTAHLPVPGLRALLKPLILRSRARLGNCYGIRLDFFPDTFWSPGIQSDKIWTPEQPLNIPRGAVLHHANWASGTADKIAQFEHALQTQNKNSLHTGSPAV